MEYKVLIVDDSTEYTKIAELYFQQQNDIHLVGTAQNGVEALEKIEQLKTDVVVLDIIMAQMDGISVLEKIQDLSHQPYVIMQTAFGNDHMIQRAMAKEIGRAHV